MFDSFAGTIGLVVVALLEMISVVYVYGHEKFTNDIFEMTGYRPGMYWQITWRYIGPVIMTVILVSSIVFMIIENPKYQAWNAELGAGVPTAYPGWVMSIAVCMICAGVLPMPIVFIMRRCQCLKLDVDIHQGSIRRIETTASTKEMIDEDDEDEDDDDKFTRPDGIVGQDSDEDEPPTMLNRNTTRNFSSTERKRFQMEVIDF